MEQTKRWRLILGQAVEKNFSGHYSLTAEEQIMDEALSAIYDDSHQGGLEKSSITLTKWLGDVRTFFPTDVVSVIQNDAIERKGLTQLLFEPEMLSSVKPSIEMVATLISLKGKIPEKTKDSARELVRLLVEEVKQLLENDIRQAVKGAINKKSHSPLPSGAQSIDWKYTINRNLKNYDKERKIVIPERFYFFDRARKQSHWTIILDIDQSGSMAESAIYASIIGSIFASLPALKTHVVVFDTEVVDLTEQSKADPVDMLFGIQLGGGTDIHKSLQYCEPFITDPLKTIFILVSDLYEFGNQAGMLKRMREMHESGVKVIALLALSDKGIPVYHEGNAQKLGRIGIPCFGCTPNLLPQLLEDVLKKNDLGHWMKKG